MTLREFFVYVGNHPQVVVIFFAALPLVALLLGLAPREQRGQAPLHYLYSLLIYLVTAPGLFVLSLILYGILFERQSLLDLNIYSQVLPIVSMILTLSIIRKDVDLRYVPGFEKLSGLMVLISAVLGLLWIVDRTRIFAILSLRFEHVVLIFIGLLVVLRFGFRQAFGSAYRSQG